VPHAGPGAEHPAVPGDVTPQQCSTRRTRTGTDLRLGRGECITRGVGTDAAARQAADLEAPPRQTRSRATTVRLGEQSCARHRTLHPSPDTASLAGHDCAPSGTVVAPGVPRLFGSANSRAPVAGHCVPRRTRLCPKRHSRGTRRATTVRLGEQSCVRRRTLRPSQDTTVPQAAQSWHTAQASRLSIPARCNGWDRRDACPTRSRATTVRLGEQSCVRRRTLRPSPDTTVPQAAQSWHPTP